MYAPMHGPVMPSAPSVHASAFISNSKLWVHAFGHRLIFFIFASHLFVEDVLEVVLHVDGFGCKIAHSSVATTYHGRWEANDTEHPTFC